MAVLPLKWRRVRNDSELVVYVCGDYRIEGTGSQAPGGKFIRTWTVFHKTALLDRPARLADGKEAAGRDAWIRANQVNLSLTISNADALYFIALRGFNGLTKRHRESSHGLARLLEEFARSIDEARKRLES